MIDHVIEEFNPIWRYSALRSLIDCVCFALIRRGSQPRLKRICGEWKQMTENKSYDPFHCFLWVILPTDYTWTEPSRFANNNARSGSFCLYISVHSNWFINAPSQYPHSRVKRSNSIFTEGGTSFLKRNLLFHWNTFPPLFFFFFNKYCKRGKCWKLNEVLACKKRLHLWCFRLVSWD